MPEFDSQVSSQIPVSDSTQLFFYSGDYFMTQTRLELDHVLAEISFLFWTANLSPFASLLKK